MTLQFIYGMLVGCMVMAVTMFLASSVILNKAYRLGVSHGQQIIEIRQEIKKTQEIIGKTSPADTTAKAPPLPTKPNMAE